MTFYWTLSHFLKPVATINLPKSLTFVVNFFKGVKICHFSSEIIFGQHLQTFVRFFLVTLLTSYDFKIAKGRQVGSWSCLHTNPAQVTWNTVRAGSRRTHGCSQRHISLQRSQELARVQSVPIVRNATLTIRNPDWDPPILYSKNGKYKLVNACDLTKIKRTFYRGSICLHQFVQSVNKMNRWVCSL